MASDRHTGTRGLDAAEQRLFSACGLDVASRRLRLADPPVAVRVLEDGEGPLLALVHGSGMSAPTWAPLMAHLSGHRLIALDLHGFGLSDPFDYRGCSLRRLAVAQLTSLFAALGVERATVVGTSLAGMWALCLAVAAVDRVAANRDEAVGHPLGSARSEHTPGKRPGARAVALIPDAHLEVIPGRHAPSLADPERCAAWITDLARQASAAPKHDEPTSGD